MLLRWQAVEDVVQGGTGLAFVVYPEALSHMPGAPAFSVLFFIMLCAARPLSPCRACLGSLAAPVSPALPAPLSLALARLLLPLLSSLVLPHLRGAFCGTAPLP